MAQEVERLAQQKIETAVLEALPDVELEVLPNIFRDYFYITNQTPAEMVTFHDEAVSFMQNHYRGGWAANANWGRSSRGGGKGKSRRTGDARQGEPQVCPVVESSSPDAAAGAEADVEENADAGHGSQVAGYGSWEQYFNDDNPRSRHASGSSAPPVGQQRGRQTRHLRTTQVQGLEGEVRSQGQRAHQERSRQTSS